MNIEELLKALQAKFAWIEEQGMKVGEVYLHPDEAKVLQQNVTHFDMMDPENALNLSMMGSKPGFAVGYLWGASVRQTPEIVPRHVMIIPEGLVIFALGGCCMPL